MAEHWALIRDARTENFKSDLSWLITVKAVKVRESLRNWGYIASDKCTSCPRRETIYHCFLNCPRVKLVWSFFVPLLSVLLTPLFLLSQIVFLFSFSVSRPVFLGTVRSSFISLRPFCTAFGSFAITPRSTMVMSQIVPSFDISLRTLSIALN